MATLSSAPFPPAPSQVPHFSPAQVRDNLSHVRSCFSGRSGSCQRCHKFQDQLHRHAETCSQPLCPVEGCHSIKQQLQYQFGHTPYHAHHHHHHPSLNVGGGLDHQGHAPSSTTSSQHPRQLVRRSSFGGVDQYYYEHASMLYTSLSQYETSMLQEDSPTSRFIEARADEIVSKLDKEEPLLPPASQPTSNSEHQPTSLNANALPPASLGGRPASLRTAALGAVPGGGEDVPYQPTTMLSPIVERSEDSPSFPTAPQLWGASTQPMSLMSSYELDGVIGQASKTMPSLGMNSLGGQDDNLTEYPEQVIKHRLRDVSGG